MCSPPEAEDCRSKDSPVLPPRLGAPSFKGAPIALKTTDYKAEEAAMGLGRVSH